MVELKDNEVKLLKEFKKNIINEVMDLINNEILNNELLLEKLFKENIKEHKKDFYLSYCVIINILKTLNNLKDNIKLKIE